MHYLYQSNRLEHLAEMLAAVLRADPPAPLAPEDILVHSPGMATWLRLHLAERLGIAANFRFPLPSSFFWQLHRQLHPALPEQSAWSKEAMLWHLMALLPDMLTQPDGAPLAEYLRDDRPLRRFQLCQQIADLFDQYLVYRPRWMAEWERGETGDVPAHRRWQPRLWQQLAARIRALAPEDLHRGELMNATLLGQRLHQARLPKRVCLFGPTSQPAAQLEALGALGEQLDVHLFLLNPSAEYWGHVQSDRQLARRRVEALRNGQAPDQLFEESGNPLLASLGGQGRELLELLLGGLWPETVELDSFEAPEETSLLGQVQADIFHLRDGRTAPRLPAALNIQLHDCHSPMREVEVLHDRLLALFEQHPGLAPRDVVVMMPQVSDYAPLIEAVFGADSEHPIPWAIADRSLAEEAPVLRAFLQLLQPRLSRFTANEVMDLLDVAPLRERFGFSVDELPLLRGWIEQAHIRWGLDAEHRTRLGLPAFSENSWAAGLERLLLGVAMGEDETLWQGIPSLPGLTQGQAELAGKLAWCLRQLQRFDRDFNQPCSAARWQQRLNLLLDDCFQEDAAWQSEIDQLRAALDTFASAAGQALDDTPLDVDMVQGWLRQQLAGSAGGQRFLAGRVNFCTLMPMRSVPFRVVCLLGMQDDAYPRPEQPAGHDLMRDRPLPGDRSRRSEDRYLFLEALLSARDELYISWCGRDSRDNSERPPSVVRAELTDYLDQAFVTDDGARLSPSLIVRHPLQPFSPRYFGSDEKLFSYSSLWGDVAAGSNIASLPMSTLPDDDTLAERLLTPGISDLARFLKNPPRALLEQRLGIYLGTRDDVLDDDEPFAPDGLDIWQLEKDVLEQALAGEDLDDLMARWQGRGQLPPGNTGRLFLQEHVAAAEEHAHQIRRLWQAGELLPGADFSVSADGVTVSGHFRELTSAGWQARNPSRLFREAPKKATPLADSRALPKVRHLLEYWLTHLALNTLPLPEQARTSMLYFRDVRLQLAPLPPAQATAHLQTVLQRYRRGLSAPLTFLPQTGWAALVYPDEPARVEAELLGNDRSMGEAADPAVARLFPFFTDQQLRDFAREGERLLSPLRQAAEVLPYE
jgi:exodeoxyribonuclease V gamma subunit